MRQSPVCVTLAFPDVPNKVQETLSKMITYDLILIQCVLA